MVEVEQRKRGYVGQIVLQSWVLNKPVVDGGIDVHQTPEGAIQEIQERLRDLGGGPPEVLGVCVERNNPNEAVFSVRLEGAIFAPNCSELG